jgi:hypothetical protein
MRKLTQVLFTFAAFAALGAAVPLPARAAFSGIVLGEPLSHQLSVCLKKEDAILIADTHADKGRDAAAALWEANDNCASVPLFGGLTAGAVVHSRQTVRDNQKVTISVIEIKNSEGGIPGYIMTTLPVAKSKAEVKENDA